MLTIRTAAGAVVLVVVVGATVVVVVVVVGARVVVGRTVVVVVVDIVVVVGATVVLGRTVVVVVVDVVVVVGATVVVVVIDVVVVVGATVVLGRTVVVVPQPLIRAERLLDEHCPPTLTGPETNATLEVVLGLRLEPVCPPDTGCEFGLGLEVDAKFGPTPIRILREPVELESFAIVTNADRSLAV